jgi:hypothetical protein
MTDKPAIPTRGTDRYNYLIEQCSAIITERYYRHKMELIEMYHELGESIRQAVGPTKQITKLVSDIAQDLGVSERNIWYSVQFYDWCPQLDKLPEKMTEKGHEDDKRVSWTMIKQNLPAAKQFKSEEKSLEQRVNNFIKKNGVYESMQFANKMLEIIKRDYTYEAMH